MASLHLSWKGERLYLTLGRSAVGISWRPTDGGAAKAKLYFADHGIMTLKCLVLPCPCLTGMLSWALREVAVGMFYTMQSCRPTRKEWTSPERSHLVLGQHQSSGQVGMGVGGGCLGCGGAVGEPLSCARSSWWIMQILIEKVIKLKPWSFSKSLRCCVLHVCAESGTENTLWDCTCRPDTRRTGGKMGCGKLSGIEKLLMHWAGSLFELSSYS